MDVRAVSTQPAGLPYATACGPLYASVMARTEFMGVEAARKVLGQRVDAAKGQGDRTVITKHGQPQAILIDMEWFRRASEAMGEPTDL